MPGDEIYYLHERAVSREEAEAFIQAYRRSARKRSGRYAQLLTHIPHGSYVLDYGCGWGILAEMIHSLNNCRIDGIEPDVHSIEIARAFIGEKEGLSFSQRGIHELDSNTYDIVVSTQVAEHTLNPGSYLAGCNRVLRPDGYLIISVPNILTPRHFVSALGLGRSQKMRAISDLARKQPARTREHVQAWDATTFCRLLSYLGFQYESHEFTEGIALPGGAYWRHPWGPFRHWSYTMMFKMRKVEFIASPANE